jgi:hypothetical protein
VVSCLDGRQCNGSSCAAFEWGCQTVDPIELDPGCTGKLSKVMGKCRCQDGRSIDLTCGIDATCDDVCLGVKPTTLIPSLSPRGTGAPVGGACTQNGALVCGTTASCSANDLILQCQNGVYAHAWQCPQGQTCSNLIGITSIACYAGTIQYTYAIEATPCTAQQATLGAAACTFDRSKIVVCQQGSWKATQTCATGTRCDNLIPGEGLCPASSAPGGCIGCK